MSVLQAYGMGWRRLWQNRPYWGLFFALNFGLALTTAASLTAFLGKNAAHSLSISDSLTASPYPFLSALTSQFASDLDFFQYQSVGVALVFFLLQIWLLGGWLNHLREEATGVARWGFWGGAARYFWRTFRLAAYFAVIQGALLWAFVKLGASIAKDFSILELWSEFDFLHALWWLLPLYLLFSVSISLWHDYAKIHTVYRDRAWLTRPVVESTRLCFKYFGRFFSLYALNLFTLAAVCAIYGMIANSIPAHSMAGIVLLFLWGQLLLLLRIGLKLANLAAADYLYRQVSDWNAAAPTTEGITQRYNDVFNPKAEAL
ncbi:MAG: hypothetical protein AAFW73_04320 [Bacteroidota bacterium]